LTARREIEGYKPMREDMIAEVDAAADALESLHAEVERAEESARFRARMNAKATAALADRGAEVESQRSIIDRQTNAYNTVAARLADRDAQIAEALAQRLDHGAQGNGYAQLVERIKSILSRSPRGAADRLKAEALEEAAEHLAGMMRGFPQDGRHTRAGWAVEMLKTLAGRARAEGEPTASGDRS
jgi:hypothetical protein